MAISIFHDVLDSLLGRATNAVDVAPPNPAGSGVDPEVVAAMAGRESAVDSTRSTVLSDVEAARATSQAMQQEEATAVAGASGIDPNTGSPSTSLSSGDPFAVQAAQSAQSAYAQQQAQYIQQMQQYQQQMTAYQQQVWQQAMAQQQTAAMMNQMNAQAQAQAMSAATGPQSLSADEIAAMVAELYDEEGTHVEGYDDGNGEESRRTLEASETDDLGGGANVSLEKVSGGPMSSAEIEAAIENACDLNGVSDDPEVRRRFVNVWTQMAMHESGGDPNAGNGWDSNAVGEIWEDGLPAQSSRGAWQCIPDTFSAYHVAGTSDSIYDPEASAAASVNYSMQRYGIGPDGSGLDEFAASRGIDPDSGDMVGGYVGY